MYEENNFENEFETIINKNNEKKILKPLKKMIGFFNIILLINFFILQFNQVTNFNYYIQLLLNEIICIYLWIEIREIKIKYHINKVKIILFGVFLIDIISFLYQLKIFPYNSLNKSLFDFIMLLVIYLTDILFVLLCLFSLFSTNKFLNKTNNI